LAEWLKAIIDLSTIAWDVHWQTLTIGMGPAIDKGLAYTAKGQFSRNSFLSATAYKFLRNHRASVTLLEASPTTPGSFG